MKARQIATGWHNRQPIGQPPRFEATDWRDETDCERRARRGFKPLPSTKAEAPRTARGIAVEQGRLI